MKAKVLLAAGALGVFSITSALAVPYADLVLPNNGNGVALGQNGYTSGTFDLRNPGSLSFSWDGLTIADIGGFNPATMDAALGYVEFFMYDTSGASHKYHIDLGSADLDGSFTSYEFAGGPLSVDVLTTISNTGQLSYKVTNTGSGTFIFEGAYLVIDTQGTTSVPDGGATALLLGTSLLGLLGVRKISASSREI